MDTCSVTSVSGQVKDVLVPRLLISLVLPVLCNLVPPTAGTNAFKESSDVTTTVLQINASRSYCWKVMHHSPSHKT